MEMNNLMEEKNMIPEELYEEIKKGDCIIFAGAGISTEGGLYGKPTFYGQIKKKCGYKDQQKPSFPEVMQKYCDKFGKNRLLREIIKRIEFFSRYGEIYFFTVMFHSYLAQIPFFKTIVTTNWDAFFERELNILVPMVEDKDIPFWDDQKKQILKIHGCITRPHTIVATSKNYKNLIKTETKKPIFTKLKDLMATKTFLFVGYSMSDKNIQLIYDTLLEKLGEFVRVSYAIDPDPTQKVIKNWKKRNVKIIKVNGIAFMRYLIDKLARENILPDPELLIYYKEQYDLIAELHTRLDQNSDKKFLSMMYQDGMLHQLQEIFHKCKYGATTIDGLKNILKDISKQKNKFIKDGNSIEIAYWSGRVEILKRFLNKKKENIPMYFDTEKKKPSKE